MTSIVHLRIFSEPFLMSSSKASLAYFADHATRSRLSMYREEHSKSERFASRDLRSHIYAEVISSSVTDISLVRTPDSRMSLPLLAGRPGCQIAGQEGTNCNCSDRDGFLLLQSWTKHQHQHPSHRTLPAHHKYKYKTSPSCSSQFPHCWQSCWLPQKAAPPRRHRRCKSQ